jgi:hypothetical protein
MAKRNLWLGILAMLLVFGLCFTACSTDSGEKNDTLVYTSKDSGGNTYKLEITKNASKAAFTPESGDNYKLTITYMNGTTKTSTGTVASYSSTAISFEGATSFTVTITSSGRMTEIKGTIPLDDNTTVTAPGAVTPQDNNPGGASPAANPFANTKWKAESDDPVDGHVVGTLSFGTDTWSYSETYDGKPSDTTFSGTYTVSGNTAILSGDVSSTATISGNVLTLDSVPIPFTKVN